MNIKPPRHRFGLSLCLGLAISDNIWQYQTIFESILQYPTSSSDTLIDPNFIILQRTYTHPSVSVTSDMTAFLQSSLCLINSEWLSVSRIFEMFLLWLNCSPSAPTICALGFPWHVDHIFAKEYHKGTCIPSKVRLSYSSLEIFMSTPVQKWLSWEKANLEALSWALKDKTYSLCFIIK